MSQLSSVSHISDYVHEQEFAPSGVGALRKMFRGIAMYLRLRSYPEVAAKRRERTVAKKALKKPEFVDWKVAEWSIHRVDPKSFSW